MSVVASEADCGTCWMRGDREYSAIDRHSNAKKALHEDIGEGIKGVMEQDRTFASR